MPPDPPPLFPTFVPNGSTPVRAEVNTQLYYSFSTTAITVAQKLMDGLLASGQALESTEGMAGDDPDIARPWTAGYDEAAKTVFEVGHQLVEAWFSFAYRLHQAGVNHEMTEYNAGGGKGQAPSPPPAPSVVSVQLTPPPSAYKASDVWLGGSFPDVIADVLKRITSPVHNARPDALRAAGSGWRLLENASTAPVGAMILHGVPEIDEISPEFDSLIGSLSAFHQTAAALSKSCTDFGDQVQHARDEITSALNWLAIGTFVTWAAGILLTEFTAGGSDAAAAALDSAEGGIAADRVATVVGEANAVIRAEEIAQGSTAVEDAGLASRLAASVEAPVVEVEAIGAEGVDATGVAAGRAGWSARKAEAWERYVAKTKAGKTKNWSEERWSRNYDSNKLPQNARQGKEYDTEVRSRPEYSKENGWTGKEHSDSEIPDRRWDDYNEETNTYAEFKSGRLSNDQLPYDTQQLDRGANMQYEMKNPSPSDVAKLERMAKEHPNGDVILNGQVLPKS